jgi:hypothetical protein
LEGELEVAEGEVGELLEGVEAGWFGDEYRVDDIEWWEGAWDQWDR